jgi:acetyltransferase-like isoleucine patch superfamily enzyme
LRKLIKKILKVVVGSVLIVGYKIVGPPRTLRFGWAINKAILKAFGAKVGEKGVRIHSPLILNEAQKGYGNLTIGDRCYFNGNNYLDLSAPITLEKGVSLGPGVIIMTHNRYNGNAFLETHLAHTCGKKGVLIKEGAGVKSGAVVVQGITIGRNAVVGAGAVVNRDVGDNCFVAGVPARLVKEIK